MSETIRVKISPGSISSDIVQREYSGITFGVYSGLSKLLSGSTNSTSLLTGLTLPILLTQDIKDIGYYTPFDGNIYQDSDILNFIFSGTTGSPYTVTVYNTSNQSNKFSDNSSYSLDWGDGTPTEMINNIPITHLYPQEEKYYNMAITQNNNFGFNIISKKIKLPFSILTNENPNGKFYFYSFNGNWSATPISYDYIFSGDSVNDKQKQSYNKNVTLSGFTKSRIEELSLYGQQKYLVGVPVIKYGDIFGVIDDMSDSYTGYTIQGIKYLDYIDGSTIFIESYSSYTESDIVAEFATKDEFMMGMVDQPQIQTNVFVERGVVSPYERILRLGEVSNMLDLENYGFGYFDLKNKP